MKNYLTGLLHIAFRAPYIYVALFIAILSFTLPLVVDSYVFGPGMLDEEMRINRMILQTNLDGGAYDKAPDEVVQSARKDLELINGFFDNGETNKRFGFASRYYGRAVLQIERGPFRGTLMLHGERSSTAGRSHSSRNTLHFPQQEVCPL